MKIKFSFLFILILISVCVNAEPIDRVVAKVGDSVITRSDMTQALNQQKVFLSQTLPSSEAHIEFSKFQANLLNELILQKVLASEIDRAGISVQASDVEQEITNRRNQMGLDPQKFSQELLKEGLSYSDYQEMIESELKKQEFIQKKNHA